MNPSNLALRAGFVSLLAMNGELVLYRGAQVRVVVNRNLMDRAARQPDFDLRDNSEIRMLASAVSILPSPGEDMTDGYGQNHRIQDVKTLGGFYTCRCRPSIPLPDFLSVYGDDMLITNSNYALQAG